VKYADGPVVHLHRQGDGEFTPRLYDDVSHIVPNAELCNPAFTQAMVPSSICMSPLGIIHPSVFSCRTPPGENPVACWSFVHCLCF
jgi:hypothetical protein